LAGVRIQKKLYMLQDQTQGSLKKRQSKKIFFVLTLHAAK